MIKAMILAAGFGTRLKPITKHTPKALVKVDHTPLLEILISKFKNAGINNIVINTHYLSHKIEEFLQKNNNFDVDINLSYEKEILDTGGGIVNAVKYLKDCDAFFVHNVDILSDLDFKKMLEFHQQEKALATLAISDRKSNRYFVFDESKTLCGWGNKESKEEIITRNASKISKYGFSGIHILTPSIFDKITTTGKFSIVPTYLELSKSNKIIGFEHEQRNWVDVGKLEDLHEARSKISSGEILL